MIALMVYSLAIRCISVVVRSKQLEYLTGIHDEYELETLDWVYSLL